MKKIALTLALAIFGLTASYAQKAEKAHLSPEQKAQKSTAKLQTELALNAKQKDAVYKIELDKFKHNEAWHKTKHDAKTDKDKQKAFVATNKAQLEQLLTPDQKKKFVSMEQEKKAHKKDKKHKAEKSKA